MSTDTTKETCSRSANVAPARQQSSLWKQLRAAFRSYENRRDLAVCVLAVISIWITLHSLGYVAKKLPLEMLVWDLVDFAITVGFCFEFYLSKSRLYPKLSWMQYALKRWWELPSLIPITSSMMEGFDGMMVFRAIRAVRIWRLFFVLLKLKDALKHIDHLAERAQISMFLLVGTVVVLFGAVGLDLAESKVNDKLPDFGEAVWWSFNLFTNVAYLEHYPVTDGGRFVSGVLQVLGMIFNIALITRAYDALTGRHGKTP